MAISVTRRGAKWEAGVRVAGYPRSSKRFHLKADAKKWAQDLEDRYKGGAPAEDKGTTLEAMVDRYIEHELPRRSETTARTYKNMLARCVSSMGALNSKQLTPERIHQFLDVELTCAGPTRNRYHAVLGAVFSYVSKAPNRMISANPMPQVPKYLENEAKDRVFTEGEIALLLDTAYKMAADAKLGGNDGRKCLPLFLRLLNETGCRRLEALTLTMDRVYPNRSIKVLAKNKNARTGKPDLRACLISEGLLNDLMELERGNSPFAFPGRRKNDGTYAHATLDNVFSECRKLAGVENCGFHTYRHTAITRVGNNGASLAQLQAFSGHKTPQMVMRYLHTNEDTLRGASLLNGV